MSNPLAIRAVTATLRELLLRDDAINAVSVRPPDRLLASEATSRLNLYLYRVAPNSAWQNSSLPDRTQPSEYGFPPLALDLFYLLTAYGDDSEESREHELLGRAMHIFHNNASISREFLRIATQRLSGGELVSDLQDQIERIRITHDPLSVDDLSKLWNTFQTQHRISTSYRVSVVLIDSARPAQSALPVLRRGEEDRGAKVFVGLDPRLERLVYRHNARDDLSQLGASLDGRVAIHGANLPDQGLTILIRDPRTPAGSKIDADVVGSLQPLPSERPNIVEFDLTDAGHHWQAGIYMLGVVYERDRTTLASNQLPIAIVPEIRKRADGRPIVQPIREGGKNKLQVEVKNGVHDARSAFLILNSRQKSYQVPRDKRSKEDAPENPVFDIASVASGEYRMRVRIDGVDSLLTTTQSDPQKRFLEFDTNMTITV